MRYRSFFCPKNSMKALISLRENQFVSRPCVYDFCWHRRFLWCFHQTPALKIKHEYHKQIQSRDDNSPKRNAANTEGSGCRADHFGF